MKPLKIAMTAFGPYKGKVEIAFETLGSKGLFLIAGDTGSGKTTIFDGLTFALFGQVSGSTRTPSMLRSDFAGLDSEPLVELDFLYRGQPYRIERSPRFERVSKRGEGKLVEVGAMANLIEPDGSMISGVKEVNKRIEDLLGLDYFQFTHIAMLAQGEFLKLLKSDTSERSKILKKIFDTSLYHRFTAQLEEERRQAEEQIRDLDKRIFHHIEGIQPMDEAFAAKLAVYREKDHAYSLNGLTALLTEVLEKDSIYLGEKETQQEQLQKQLQDLSTEKQRIATTNRYLQKLQQIVAEKETLLNIEENSKRWKHLAERGKRAAKIVPLDLEYQRVKAKIDNLTKQLGIEGQKKDLANQKYHEKQQSLLNFEARTDEIQQKNLSLNELEKLKPQYQKVATLTIEREKLEQQTKKVDERLLAVHEEILTTDTLRATINSQLEKGKEAGLKLNQCTHQQKDLNVSYNQALRIKAGLQQLSSMEEELAKKQEHYRSVGVAYQQASEAYQRFQKHFLDNQAGILAKELQVGMPCPVCGSVHHPHPKTMVSEAPDKETIEQTKVVSEQYHQEWITASKETAVMDTKVKNQIDSIGQLCYELSEEEIPFDAIQEYVESFIKDRENELACVSEKINQLTRQMEEYEQLSAEYQKLEEKSAILIKEVEELRDQKAEVDKRVIITKTELEAYQKELKFPNISFLETECQRIKNEIDEYKGQLQKIQQGYNSVRELVIKTEERFEQLKKQLKESEAETKERQEKLLESIQENGFADEVCYQKAILSEAEIKQLEGQVAAYESKKSELNQEYEHLKVETEGFVWQDENVLVEKIQLLEMALKNNRNDIVSVSARQYANQNALKGLNQDLNSYEAIRDEYSIIKELADTASGNLMGKQKLAFEQYVQGVYFDQILNAANRRLLLMSNNSYELVRKEGATNNQSKSGLEIDVLDYRTGVSRSAMSLSGGESFIASLSLALGLSDIIEASTGGIQIDAVFVDEGFGTLDEELLENAISVLNGLTEGNRIVGIISHVAELKSRIDKKIIVKKGIDGSYVQVEG